MLVPSRQEVASSLSRLWYVLSSLRTSFSLLMPLPPLEKLRTVFLTGHNKGFVKSWILCGSTNFCLFIACSCCNSSSQFAVNTCIHGNRLVCNESSVASVWVGRRDSLRRVNDVFSLTWWKVRSISCSFSTKAVDSCRKGSYWFRSCLLLVHEILTARAR